MEGLEIIKTNQANAIVLNDLFSNIIKNLEIPQYNRDLISQNIMDPVIKAIIKYRNYPAIIAIKERCTNSEYSFSFIEKNDIFKEIKNLQINKATQDSDIPTKIIKNNLDLFADFLVTNLNDSIAQPTIPSLLKPTNITLVHKKTLKHQKIIIDQLVYY